MTPTQLIRHYGNGDPTVAAKAIPVTRQTLMAWKKTGKIPGRWQAWFELNSNGKLLADRKAIP